MPPRVPITLPYHIGTDLVHINRIRELIARKLQANDGGKRLSRFLDRVLHPLERQDFNQKFPAFVNFSTSKDLQGGNHDLTTQFHKACGTWLAGRWAAKEAAKKAWGAQTLGFKDVRVEVCEGGAVQMVCSGWRKLAADQQPERVEQLGRLSISHDGEYAIATVMATPLEITPVSLPEAASQ